MGGTRMKKADLVVMLTHKDITVPNAIELFNICSDLPVKCWGFKDVGLSDDDVVKLGKIMKAAGKTTTYEIVTNSDAVHEKAAELAIKGEFDYVACGYFYQPLADKLKAHGIGYLPSNGRLVHVPHPDGPVVMVSTKDELLENSKYALSHGATGFDVVGYRSNQYDCDELMAWVRKELPGVYLCAAGGVTSKERIKYICELEYDAFTTGSALFDGVYAENGSFRENLIAVNEYLESLFL
jgi:hypothetical protein